MSLRSLCRLHLGVFVALSALGKSRRGRNVRPLSVVASLALIASSACTNNMTEKTDLTLAIVNARVWTANPKQPWASAVAVSGSKILAVGSSAEIAKLAKATPSARVIDAGGALVTPGFIDSHVHFIDGGFRLSSVQLRDAKTKDEFIARIKAYAATVSPGTWITGGDWDHTHWGGELPRRDWIDSVTPNNPVWISRLDGHMALANGLALTAGKVTAATADVEGGTIVRDARGNPTGIFKDNAQSYVNAAEPPASNELVDRALVAAMKYVAEQGVTSVHNMGTFEHVAAFERARAKNSLITRVYAVTPISQWERLRDTVAKKGRGDEWIRIGGLKGFVDGSLGSHTAAMFAPFTDSPADSGFLVETEKDLYTWTSNADKSGLQLILHAIGDRAIRTQLDIFERVANENGARDRRFRIEHAQHIAPSDIPRFAKLGVIPSMQPYHAIDDGRWAEAVIGPRAGRTTYAFGSLIDASGAESHSAATGSSLRRRRSKGSTRPSRGARWMIGIPADGFPKKKSRSSRPCVRTPSMRRLRPSTKRSRARLERGKLADLVIIDRDITKAAPETIRDAKVLTTIVGGRVVFERPSR